MGGPMTSMELSVIVPVYNEERVIEVFHRALVEVLDGLDFPCEIIYVNDGSRDQTGDRLDALRASDSRVRLLELSRNFGHQSALAAGLSRASGRACVFMDADLQDPPALLPRLVERWRAGVEVVYAVRRARPGDSLFKRWTARLFYRGLGLIAGVSLPPDAGDFRLLDRKVVDALIALPERHRYFRGLVSWVGFRQEGVPFDRPARAAGETKFTLWKMIRFAVDGVTSFSHVPLRLVTLAGFAASAGSAVLLAWAFYVKFVAHRTVQGWTSLIAVVLLLGGAQFLALGILGEYLARVLDETKGRPLFLVRRAAGFGEAAADRPPRPESRA